MCLSWGETIHRHLSAVIYTVIQQVILMKQLWGNPPVRCCTSDESMGTSEFTNSGLTQTLNHSKVRKLQRSETAIARKLMLTVLFRSCLQKTMMLMMLEKIPKTERMLQMTT
uniref:Uncharacterized protein n=1 Tax=Biomphalaria glabrata TaxID=6526 RepID=A0A2C9KT76_BIOGL